MHRSKPAVQGGFTYLWVLLMLTMLSLSLLKETRSREVQFRQQQEEELFFSRRADPQCDPQLSEKGQRLLSAGL